MPRIMAATVAEHHAKRRADIVAAATGLLRTGGVGAVIPSAVAAQAGLARTSLYQYYDSSGALVHAAVEAMFAGFDTALHDAVDTPGSPRQRLDAYVATTLCAAAQGHGPVASLHTTDLPEPCRARLRELHDGMARPLRSILGDADEPAALTGLVLGVLNAAAIQLEHGADLESTLARTQRFVAQAVGLA